ncbi:hypothetical protein M8C21_008724, partial [Ambrosia artemisiifolia]
ISKLPLGVIETILCFLPIHEATRTSILSREWRYHWTTIPKLVFNEDMFKGPIHEFTLSMRADGSCVEIDHIIRHLSKKTTIKILKLEFIGVYRLPLSLFSLHKLTGLYLNGCVLDHQPSSNVFRSLTTLCLDNIRTCKTELLRLVSSCPSLKRLTIMDKISKLPPGIIENILCLLPIQEAARTSILSKEWRYHWINIPQLAFIEDKFEASTDETEPSVLEQTFDRPSKRKDMAKRCKLFYAIYQVFLVHQGPICDFTLSMRVDGSCVEIDHIILHLSKKISVKMLKLDFIGRYKLPSSFFSLHQLTDLYLNDCALDPPPSFSGFGNLTTLYLQEICISDKALLRLLSSCPSLKRLTINSDGSTITGTGAFTIVDLFECLPVIEYLSIWFYIVMFFDPDRLPKKLPTTLVHLKYFQQECSKMDRISKLPIGVIETILCLLPIQEAARTSILSREWRHHWTKIPKLAFDEYTFEVSTYAAELSVLERTFVRRSHRKVLTTRCKLFYAIYQVLLMHQGPIHEFTLSMIADDSCVEIDHILLHLSKKNTIKILKLDFGGRYMLPLSLFSLHHLTDLSLSNCDLDHQPSSHVFGSLTSLHLQELQTSKKALLRLLSSCPLLERLTLMSDGGTIDDSGDSTIADLFKCVPGIEYLSFWFFVFLLFLPLPKELPTTLVHLKYLYLDGVWFRHEYAVPFLDLLIRSSPNLEKLKLVISGEDDLFDDCYVKIHSFHREDYSDFVLEHLNELEILDFSDALNELGFVKLILAKSPVLKKVRILLWDQLDKDVKLRISKIILSYPCASPVATRGGPQQTTRDGQNGEFKEEMLYKMDRISKLPLGIIETILCLLPIQEAARTSILSTEWRNRWTTIPKLVFIENKFQEWTHGPVLSAAEQYLNKPSPIHEFTLSMEVDGTCVEIDHILLHLSKKNTVKILKLDLDGGLDEGHRLPISLFSLPQLTSMYLNGCALYQERSFNEFGCLTTLYLGSVWTYAKTLLRLLSSCPSLKRLTLNCECSVIFRSSDTTIVDLFKCLPLIEYLRVVLFIVECFDPEILPKELPITLMVHLKHLRVDSFCFSHKYGLPLLVPLIRNSPNLEKLKLVMEDIDWPDEDDIGSFKLEDYSDIMFEHLNEFESIHFSDAENELDFVKLILAKSPMLKKLYEMDRMSKLPLGIIETILCLLPIQEAARTISTDRAQAQPSVLEQTSNRPSEKERMTKRSKIFNAIYQDCEFSVIFGRDTIADLFKEIFERAPNNISPHEIQGLPLLALLIRSSPNLEKLKLVLYNTNWLEDEEIGSFTLDDYSDIMLEHLKELEFQDFGDQENELDFVQLILARSPVLKRVSIFTYRLFDVDEKPEILKILCLSPRASPVVEIMVK